MIMTNQQDSHSSQGSRQTVLTCLRKDSIWELYSVAPVALVLETESCHDQGALFWAQTGVTNSQ